MNRILCAVINGKQAEALEGTPHEQIIEDLIDDLDLLYDGQAEQQRDNDNMYVTDWGNNPYIKGVKSYPLVSGTGAAEEYAKPINNRLFFAGEATATAGNFGTVQGALDSAERVVKEILEAIL
jgi:monoamine oxidase